ncbi:MAG: DUF72 domain-containing protein [Actinobacteria bacterium]|nr:DUF72 domain-containing protein [Actinomycetota bacterium]
MTVGRIRVGTSGWSYDHWAGVFYPDRLPAARRLEFYASRFDTVEIDATFYRLPSEHAVASWRDAVPDGFVFAVKGSRLITHFRRLADVDDALATFLGRMSVLGEKLDVVLWQLPPNLPADTVLLARFLKRLPTGRVRHVVEFRHESWLAEETFTVLREYGAAHVHVSSDAMPESLTPTADFVYARFHGTSSCHGAYDSPALEPWAGFLRGQADSGRDCYAYFNNDAAGHAPADAARLIDMLGVGATRTVAKGRSA